MQHIFQNLRLCACCLLSTGVAASACHATGSATASVRSSTATAQSTVKTAAQTTVTNDESAMSKVNPLPVGSVAPAFTFRTADGQEHHTDSLKGKPYVVYFYPKDMTPGCTTQACAFRDSYADFKEAGITVIGISADSEESHNKFRSKHDLPFALASDPERKIIEAYGVWAPKLFMGKSFLGIHRITFLVGPDGKIAKVYPKVKPADNAAEVLEDARKL